MSDKTRGQLLQEIYAMIQGHDMRPFKRVMTQFKQPRSKRQLAVDELCCEQLEVLLADLTETYADHSQKQQTDLDKMT